MKTIEEQIAVMQHFANGGDIEVAGSNGWIPALAPLWDWTTYDYRIKEVPKTVKYLCWEDVNGYLVWQRKGRAMPVHHVRVPQLDKEIAL